MTRYKNYGLWVAIAALVFMFLQDFGVQITPEKFNGYVDAILTVFVLLGIVSNPTTENKGFGDDK